MKADINRLQKSVTGQVKEWRNEQWGVTLESLGPEEQSLWKVTNCLVEFPLRNLPISHRRHRYFGL
jgi:hypothetical protein